MDESIRTFGVKESLKRGPFQRCLPLSLPAAIIQLVTGTAGGTHPVADRRALPTHVAMGAMAPRVEAGW